MVQENSSSLLFVATKREEGTRAMAVEEKCLTVTKEKSETYSLRASRSECKDMNEKADTLKA